MASRKVHINLQLPGEDAYSIISVPAKGSIEDVWKRLKEMNIVPLEGKVVASEYDIDVPVRFTCIRFVETHFHFTPAFSPAHMLASCNSA
jgi:hypothetical protein